MWPVIALIAVVAVVAFVFYLRAAGRKWRAERRREIVEYFREHAPEFELEESGEYEMKIKREDGEESSFYLHNVYGALARIPERAADARSEIYQTIVDTIRESAMANEVVPERDRAALFPRIMRNEDIASMHETTKVPIPAAPLSIAGLSVVFVLNRTASVQYVNEETLEQLQMSVDEALELAKDNLRESWSCEGVRGAVEQRALAMLKSGDTFDAARLLLTPECLHNREKVVALIPDRDTLSLLPVPDDGDWSGAVKLALQAEDHPLHTRPIIVTNQGFAEVDSVSQ